MRTTILLLMASLDLAASITNVRVTGTIPTQALLSYTAPDASACALEVYDMTGMKGGGLSVTAATSATPIEITTQYDHYLTTGDRVYISGVGGNTNANGYWTVTVTGTRTFQLDGSTGGGAFTSGGTVGILVHDLNTRLFAGADLDTRAGNVAGARDRVFVIGKRAAEKASDNRWYSRALQVDTDHRYRLRCGTDVAEGNFRTANIALGSPIYDVWPANADAPGGMAWPTIDWGSARTPGPNTLSNSGTTVTSAAHGLAAGDLVQLTSGPQLGQVKRVTAVSNSNQFTINSAFSADQANQSWVKLDPTKTASAQTIIDPQSGVLLRRMSGLRAFPPVVKAAREAWGGWTDPGNVIADDGAAASYTGTGAGTQPWMTVTSSYVTPGYGEGWLDLGSSDGAYNQVGYVEVLLKGSASAAGADGSVDVCLSKNGVDCFTRVVTQDLSQCASGCLIGSTEPVLKFWEPADDPAKTALPRKDLFGRTGTATWTAATKKLAITPSEQGFNLNWKPGSRITVDGVSRVIASVDGLYQLTLEDGPAADGSYSYSASNFSVLIRKTTPSADRVNVQYVSFYVGTETGAGVLYTGDDRCSPVKATQTYNGTSRDGYVCESNHGDTLRMHWIDPVTGDAVFLARTMLPSGADKGKSWGPVVGCATMQANATDPRKLYCSAPLREGGTGLVEATYNGTMLDQPIESPSTQFTQRLVDADGKSITELMSDFLAANDPAGPPLITNNGACALRAVTSHYASFVCWWGTQDSYGWMALMDIDTGRIVAAASSNGYFPLRHCAIHGSAAIESVAEGKIYIQPNVKSSGSGSGCGQGPWQTEVSGGLPLPPSGNVACPAKQWWEETTGANPRTCTTITVSGDLYDPTPCPGMETSARGDAMGIPWLGARPGDIFATSSTFTSTAEFIQLLEKNGDTWTVLRGVYGSGFKQLSAAAPVYAHCTAAKYPMSINAAAMMFWDYAQSPAGADATKMFIIESSHYMQKFDRRVNEGYLLTEGTPPEMAAQYANQTGRKLAFDPAFAGKLGNPGSDTHPSMGQSDPSLTFQLDQSPLYASPWRGNEAITTISAPLYRMTPGLNRKYFPTMAFCGSRPLVDVSGPGSKIANGAGDSYKYCVIERDAATECTDGSGNPYAGAAVGQALFNCPYLTSTTSGCGSMTEGTNDSIHACIADANARFDTAYQLGIGPVKDGDDKQGRWSRTLSRMLGYPHRQSFYQNITALPDASWAVGFTALAGGTENILLGVKLPPYPADDGPASAGTFTPVPVHVSTTPPPGTDNVVVEFGYDPDFHCTSRGEACVSATGGAAEQPVNEALPFYWAGEAYTGVPCSNGCTVTIPALSQRVLYYRVKYRAANGSVVGAGRTEVQTTP